MAWFRVRRGVGNNSVEIQLRGLVEFVMEGDKLVMKSMSDDGEEYVFMLWPTETDDLRKFLQQE